MGRIPIADKWAKKGIEYRTKNELNDGVTFDGHIPLTLWVNGRWVATVSVNNGLDELYGNFTPTRGREWYIENGYVAADAYEEHDKATEYARGLQGIVQMQAQPSTQVIRNGIAYHDILMDGLEILAEKDGFNISFFLPAKLNFWIMADEVLERRMDEVQRDTAIWNLRKNYDKVAERHDFRYSEEAALYLR